MATSIDEFGAPPRAPGRGYMADQDFFLRFAITLALFILFGFAQFAMRGYSSFSTAPITVHLHGGLMVAWLGIFVAQNMLVHRGELAVHRKLGWLSAGLVPIVALTGVLVGYNAVALNRVPPFFGNPYFLTLATVGPLLFAGTVFWAIAKRRQVQWHRRLMLGAMFLLLEPALGRLLPMPPMGAWGETAVLLVQLLFVAVLARHDRHVLGSVHPATMAVTVLLLANHALLEVISRVPAVVGFAEALAAG
ncbi:MAG: adenylate cyclase [Pseudomonadota bacterium]|nr:adenylate cyclase [Pseudomonadota bacterium]